MTSDYSLSNLPVRGSFYGSSQLGVHSINGKSLPCITSKVGYNYGNSDFQIGLGLGGVTTLSAKASHELRWDKLGLDLSVQGERNKQLLKDTENVNVNLANGEEISLSNQYRPSDIRAGIGAEATYRPCKSVKLGLGAEAGVVIPTTENNKVNVGDKNVKFKHNHLPEGYVTPKCSFDIELHKDRLGTISLIGDASLYKAGIGVKASF